MQRRTAPTPAEVEITKHLGRVLRTIRETTGMSAIQASLRIGMSKGVVGQLERAERVVSVDHLLALCNVYDTEPGWVLDLVQAATAAAA